MNSSHPPSARVRKVAVRALRCLSVSMAAVVVATAAQAGTTYTYTGNPFTVGSGSIAASVTFDSTVTGTFTGFVGLSDIESWSITSGALSISSLNPVDEPDATGYIPLRFEFSTGSIVRWDFAHKTSISLPDPYIIYTLGNSFVVGPGDTVEESPSGYVIGNPGIWAPVPEPTALSLLLVGIGIVGIAKVGRKDASVVR